MKSLSAELIAIIVTSVALAGLLLAGQHRMEDRLLAGQSRMEDRLLGVEKEQARINALLEGAGFTARIQDSKAVRRQSTGASIGTVCYRDFCGAMGPGPSPPRALRAPARVHLAAAAVFASSLRDG